MYSSGLSGIVSDDYGSINSNVNKSLSGAYLMYGGALASGIGIPIWISASNRKNDIEVALIKYKSQSSIRYDSSSLLGLNVKINF